MSQQHWIEGELNGCSDSILGKGFLYVYRHFGFGPFNVTFKDTKFAFLGVAYIFKTPAYSTLLCHMWKNSKDHVVVIKMKKVVAEISRK